jgi:hypothetical protein
VLVRQRWRLVLHWQQVLQLQRRQLQLPRVFDYFF